MHSSKLQTPLLCCLCFEFDCLNLSVLLAEFCGVRAYFQPNSVASTKIRLSRISAENMVQPAEFFEKSGSGV